MIESTNIIRNVETLGLYKIQKYIMRFGTDWMPYAELKANSTKHINQTGFMLFGALQAKLFELLIREEEVKAMI